MNNTVAIVGTHPGTRDKAPFRDPTIDIWIFNNQITQGWCPRADACFDIHPPEDIARRRLEQRAFDTFLSETKMPIYTPTAIENCPANVAYPLEKVSMALLGGFRRGETINKYFTSGPCYALALAIYKGYRVIKFYGIEMESNSEYVYQRDGVGLWFGIALGRGIKIDLPEESTMFYAPLYGYEMDATRIDREAFEVRASEIQLAMDKSFSDLQNKKGQLDNVVQRIGELQQANAPREQMAKIGEEYEKATHEYEQAIANHAFLNGQFIDNQTWKVRVEKAMEYSGKAQEVLAQNDGKWHRFVDRGELAGKVAALE